MNILHLIQTKQLRGAEIFTCQLSTQLQQLGHSVRIAALKDGAAVLPFEGSIEVLEADFKKRFWDWKAWKQIATIVKEFQPDIIQANAGDTLKYAVLSKLFFGWKQPIVFRNASMMSLYVKNGFVRWFNQQLLKRSAHVAAVSAFTKEDLIQQLHVNPSKISVLPVGVEAKEIKPVFMEPSQVHIVHVGGFSFEKNHTGLLRIFQQVHQQMPHARLWLLGEGKLLQEIKDTVQQLQLDDAVVFKGNVSNPLDYIAAADVLVLPSIIEGLPSVILEAFSCKTPVVAYDTGGVAELVNIKTGWLITKNDEAAFSKQVIQLLQTKDASAITTKTDEAYALTESRYMNHTIAKGFEELYKELIRA